MDETLNALLEVHDRVCREIGQAEINETNEWSSGHTNGVKEARNRVEQVILQRYGKREFSEEELKEAYQEVAEEERERSEQ